MKARIKPLSEIASGMGCGPMDFWRIWSDCIRDRREVEHREWLTYDEYRQIFKAAHRAGLFSVYADEKGEPSYRLHSPFGWALVRLYQAVKSARDRGLSEQQFHAEFCAQVDRDSDVVKKAAEYKEQRAREAREKAENDRRRGSERRRRDPDEDETPIEVRVGYQPQAERTAV